MAAKRDANREKRKAAVAAGTRTAGTATKAQLKRPGIGAKAKATQADLEASKQAGTATADELAKLDRIGARAGGSKPSTPPPAVKPPGPSPAPDPMPTPGPNPKPPWNPKPVDPGIHPPTPMPFPGRPRPGFPAFPKDGPTAPWQEGDPVGPDPEKGDGSGYRGRDGNWHPTPSGSDMPTYKSARQGEPHLQGLARMGESKRLARESTPPGVDTMPPTPGARHRHR